MNITDSAAVLAYLNIRLSNFNLLEASEKTLK